MKKFIYLLFIIYISCGTNLNTPVFPIYSILPIGSPAIVNVIPVEITTIDNHIRIEFDIQYYVTNKENEFIGYNLYISTSSISPDLVQAGIGINPYLPEGREPTFFHTKEEASTLSSNIITKRIPNLKPAPSEIPFQICEKYYFRLKAVLRNGITSAPSPEVSSCAISRSIPCPENAPCYGF